MKLRSPIQVIYHRVSEGFVFRVKTLSLEFSACSRLLGPLCVPACEDRCTILTLWICFMNWTWIKYEPRQKKTEGHWSSIVEYWKSNCLCPYTARAVRACIIYRMDLLSFRHKCVCKKRMDECSNKTWISL